ncbi:right-handed parallel beta-helix repeat-containing protein [Halobellus marinus]|uniref:right-handed parallel beta-helix repeat-containing protein n=1 Tax=Halobellus TaxID=1073986 RepID=UPI0028A8AF93|nr:right-handed parallel beta-helix repeat-containing protein [Halobellus sp. DFY28]
MAKNTGSPEARLTRRNALKGLTIGGTSLLAFGGGAAGSPGKGNSRGQDPCDLVVPDDHVTIQDAVDAADAGDTICVKDGTYPEQIVINKSLTLRSAPGSSPTITPESSPGEFTIAESGPAWEPLVFAYGGSEQAGDVSGPGTIDVALSGFTLDGGGTQPSARRKPGVLLRNASGTVSENTIENMGVGGKETFGILAYGDSDVTIVANSIREYERGGIGANGDGGVHPSPTARIRNNTVRGSTGLGEAWGPNGIQIGFGAAGAVRNNEVIDNRYSDESPVASGILIFESDGVAVQGNRVENADVALSCGSWGWLRQSADGNMFLKNHVVDAEFGALIEAVAEPYGGVLTNRGPSTSNNKVVNNRIEDDEGTADPDGNIGVGILLEDNVDNEFVPVADNNKLIQNTITGFDTRIEDEGTATKVAPFDP